MKDEDYTSKCSSCAHYFKAISKPRHSTRQKVTINCLINPTAFDRIVIGDYMDEKGDDREDPNIARCTQYVKTLRS